MSGGQLVLESHDHVVNFYDDDPDLVAEVSRFVADGLRDGDGVVIVATEPHRVAIDALLLRDGLDAPKARAAGQYLCLDAAETLSTFMVGDEPSGAQFAAVVGDVIDRAGTGGRNVRAFGEMVALLWDAGNVNGAIELESLWNDLARTREFALYCAYRLTSLTAGGDLVAANLVCTLHSHVIPPRSYAVDSDLPASATGAAGASELFVPVPTSVHAVRRLVRATLERWGRGRLADDACLVASELATNAIRHASSAFEVRLQQRESIVRIAVRDISPRRPERQELDEATFGGRGVAMVAQLCARWGTEARVDGKVVWAELTAD
jgi:hypothetical protein